MTLPCCSPALPVVGDGTRNSVNCRRCAIAGRPEIAFLPITYRIVAFLKSAENED
jgi:hypothetical protein